MDKKLLTIAIPTYNRSQKLNKCLASIFPQVYKYKDLVHIYISDNASDDDTKDVVLKYQMEYPNISTYHKQKSNIGPDANFVDCVENIDTSYFALIGDDDILLPNYMAIIVDKLKSPTEYGMVYMNSITFNEKENFTGLRDNINNGFKWLSYKNSCELLKRHYSAPSLISSTICNTKRFKEFSKIINIQDYPGYGWFAIICFCSTDLTCAYYDIPLIANRSPQKQRWECDYPWYFMCGLGNIFKDLEKYCPDIYKVWIESFLKQNVINQFLRIINNNRKLYCCRIPLMALHSGSKKNSILLYLYSNFSYNRAVFFERWYYRISKIKNIDDTIIRFIKL